MAKKYKINKDRSIYDSNIENVDILSSTEESMKIYGANINILRNVPLLVDGLKPVERRALFTMYDSIKCNYNKPFNKVANIVGRTMSEYHPHGDTAIYDTVVRMAQPWSNIQPTVEGQGNFGSPSGEVAGAARYIEARLSKFAYKCFFEDFDIDAIDTTMNYLGSHEEPIYLPSRYPNILINNVFGIGYGLATSIPSFNLEEVFRLTIKMLNGEEINPLTDYLIPEPASKATVIDEGQFQDICSSGVGKFKTRATTKLDKENNIITITSLPPMVKMSKVMEDINAEIDANRLHGLVDIRDLSMDDFIELELHFKKEIDLDIMLENLMRVTDLEKTTSVKFVLIDDFKPKAFNLYSVISMWIDFRIEIKTRLINRKLVKLYERVHILDILLFILNKDNAEKTLALVKKANSKKEIIDGLIKLYDIDSLKAKTVAEMRLYGFSKEARKSYEEEHEYCNKEIDSLLKVLKGNNIREEIISELEEGIELFGQPRKSKIIKAKTNDVIVKDTEHLIIVTDNGFIKKLPRDVKEIGYIEQGDFPRFIMFYNNTSEMLIFDSMGKINKLPVSDIRNSVLSKPGSRLSDFVTISGKIVSIIPKPTSRALKMLKDKRNEECYFTLITKLGIIKRSKASLFTAVQKGSTVININDDDELKDVQLLTSDKNLIVYTKSGRCGMFSSSDVPVTGRMSKGVISIGLDSGDEIIGFDIVNSGDEYLIICTEKGYVKKISISSLPLTGRNKNTLILIKLEEGDTIFKAICCNDDSRLKVFQPSGITDIMSVDVPESTRLSRGKKLIGVRRGNDIVDFIRVE